MDEKNDYIRGVLVFLEIMMTHMSRTAACKRGLLCMNLQKASIHTSLSNQALDTVYKFKTEDHINSWTVNSKGKRLQKAYRSIQ